MPLEHAGRVGAHVEINVAACQGVTQRQQDRRSPRQPAGKGGTGQDAALQGQQAECSSMLTWSKPPGAAVCGFAQASKRRLQHAYGRCLLVLGKRARWRFAQSLQTGDSPFADFEQNGKGWDTPWFTHPSKPVCSGE